MDLLSNVLSVMNLSGTLYFRTAFTAPWGVRVPPFERVARFHYVHRGRCFVRIAERGDVVLLEQGDFIMITRGASHILSDPQDVDALSVDQVIAESGFTGRGALVYGGVEPGHETQLVCGHFAFDSQANHVLIDALPPHLHVKGDESMSPGWLDSTLQLIGGELGRDRLGGDLIALKLSEIIFTQAIRHYLEKTDDLPHGLAGFADPKVRLALEAMHADVARTWSVEHLAGVAGMSRTSFSNRFGALVGHTPLGYLTEWRMQLARKLLRDTELPIIEVAIRSGYQSEASFGRVFRRHFDSPPALYRRAQAQVAGAE